MPFEPPSSLDPPSQEDPSVSGPPRRMWQGPLLYATRRRRHLTRQQAQRAVRRSLRDVFDLLTPAVFDSLTEDAAMGNASSWQAAFPMRDLTEDAALLLEKPLERSASPHYPQRYAG